MPRDANWQIWVLDTNTARKRGQGVALEIWWVLKALTKACRKKRGGIQGSSRPLFLRASDELRVVKCPCTELRIAYKIYTICKEALYTITPLIRAGGRENEMARKRATGRTRRWSVNRACQETDEGSLSSGASLRATCHGTLFVSFLKC